MKPVVEQVSGDALELTQQWIGQIRSLMDGGPTNPPGGGVGMQGMNIQEQAIVTGLLAKLMRAATGMIKEVRALQKDARDAAEGMSYEDKRKFLVNFIVMLPPEQRDEIRAQLGWQ